MIGPMDGLFTEDFFPCVREAYMTTERSGQTATLSNTQELAALGWLFYGAEDQSRVHAGKLSYPGAISLALQQVF